MSSHREAPQISKDPVADSTDLYAFVSPDNPDTVTIIANYVPLEAPDGGPNFYEFGTDVLYQIKINNKGTASTDLVYQFKFTTTIATPTTFLYNTGPIQSLTTKTWNRRQTYSVTKVNGAGKANVIAKGLTSPPCNIGPLSTPTYTGLVSAAVHPLPGGGQVFAGQRAEGFYVDLGAIFDLAILRPFEQDHATFGLQNTGLGQMAAGINSTKSANVHTIALQLPIKTVVAGGSVPASVTASNAVIGVWTTASRQKSRIQVGAKITNSGPYTQVSRLGNPLVNEVLIPMSEKDAWNTYNPAGDAKYAKFVANPELAQLLPTLYTGVFPNLKAYNAATPTRADLLAILLTGIPSGVVTGFQNTTGKKQADMLRLNVAIPPTTSSPSNLGLIGKDLAGFPNGRRVFDDVTTIELRAIAGATLPLVDKTYTADAAAGTISQGLTSSPTDVSAMNTETYLSAFPYLGVPHQGFSTPSS
jgi:hypothetical protein